MKRGVIRGEMRGDTPYTAIDHVSDTGTRQIRRYKTRYSRKSRKDATGGLGLAVAEQLAQAMSRLSHTASWAERSDTR